MDIDSQKMFDEIVRKGPTELTEPEVEFLRARRSYLSEEQRAVFKDVLTVEAEAAQEPAEESEPSKKSKKAKSEE